MVVSVAALALFQTSFPVSTTPVPRWNESWWVQRHRAAQAVTAAGGYDVAFLGDSITQGWEGGAKVIWDRDIAPLKPANFGFSGDRTEHVLWRLASAELIAGKPKVVVIMIGTNNVGHGSSNPQQTATGVREIVRVLGRDLPQTKVLLLGIFPRGEAHTDPMRIAVNQATEAYRSVADGKRVHFLDIGEHFVRADGTLRVDLMPDRLHLNELGYDLWGRSIRAKVGELLGERPEPIRGGRWQSLFDGRTLRGWTQRNGTATYSVEGGTIVGRTAPGSPNSFLCSDRTFKDFELEFEVKVDNGLNSGVQIRSRTQGDTPTGRVWGPQVEIEAGLEQAGFIYGEATRFGWLSPEPELPDGRLNRHAAFREGAWNRYRVVAQGPRIRTWINGLPIADLTHREVYETHPSGFIGLQVHSIGANEGPFQVAWRNLRVRELR